MDHPDAGALLAAREERTDVIGVTITRWPSCADPAVRVRIRPVDVFDAIDPEPTNDSAERPIERP